MVSRRVVLISGAVAVLVAAGVVAFVLTRGPSAPNSPLPLRTVHELALPGDNSRFDYASLDAQRGLLFVAHLGASEVIEIDVHANKVVRTIPNVSQVHGVFVVPALHRVYATATGTNQVVVLNEDTGEVVNQASTGNYPDGIAYDPRRNAIWTTNETGGTETVVDAGNASARGSVDLGGEVGNVVYDPLSDRMLVGVQGRNDLAVIDPASLSVTKRVGLPGCDHDHGLALDVAARLAFVACDGNATLLTVDMSTWQVTGTNLVGADPDVLAYDANAHRLYVAAESGAVSVLDLRDGKLTVAGSDHLADGAHVVAVDPGTHRSYYPVPAGSDGRPALLERESRQ
ncbi:YncE family protein [Kutzneria sp. 744]|uniref:YncE family protein n=1 Tax=Kutzneria sp. (strain 744) TaxID=345341 RepID=UPI0004B62304|nr:YncE family protein [Kutzneria sp. 744]